MTILSEDFLYTSDEEIRKLWDLLIAKNAPCIPPSLQAFYAAKICETNGSSPRPYDKIVLETADNLNDSELKFFKKVTSQMWHEIQDGLPDRNFHIITIKDKKKGNLIEEWIVGFIRATQTSQEAWSKLNDDLEYGKLFFYLVWIFDQEKNTGKSLIPSVPAEVEEAWNKRYKEIYEITQKILPLMIRQFYKFFRGEPFDPNDIDLILKNQKETTWS